MAQPSTIRAAAVQISPDIETPANTVTRVLGAIAEAAGRGARLVVFPETFVPYYPYFSFIQPPAVTGAEHLRLYEHAVVVPGPVTDAVAEAARKYGIVVVLGVNERDHGSLYNAQIVFDADGTILLKRRKITPTFHERMIWGQGDGAGLKVVDTAVGRIGALACWEHYNPLARYALMAQHEEIHVGQFPGSMVGQIFARKRLFRRQRHRLADGSTDRADQPGGEDAPCAQRRLHDGDRRSGGQPSGAAADPGRRPAHCRSRLRTHHKAQADDG
jgi:nitrilase